MTIPVSIQQRIRILDARGVSWREIARRLNVSRDTVRKYAVMEDCSPAVFRQIGVNSVGTYSGHCRRSCWTVWAVGWFPWFVGYFMSEWVFR